MSQLKRDVTVHHANQGDGVSFLGAAHVAMFVHRFDEDIPYHREPMGVMPHRGPMGSAIRWCEVQGQFQVVEEQFAGGEVGVGCDRPVERKWSDFAAALKQFVRQFVAYCVSSSGKRPWERPLDLAQDRLVLIIGPNSAIPIRVHVPVVLERLRGLAHEQSLEDAAANNAEQKALSVVVSHIRRAWWAALGSSPNREYRRG
jgi:hypothetical protein